MLKTVYANVDSAVLASTTFLPRKTAAKGNLRGFDYEEQPGFLYVAVRAVSSRVNKNFDAFTADELKKSYKTFIGRPVFVNHDNTDLSRARGVVLDARLHEEPQETWVELLLEMDAVTYPKLCAAILDGDIDTVSMGCNIEYSVCSICGNEARFASEYCTHVQRKGVTFPVETPDGNTEMRLAFEYCCGVTFFEISWVFDPADTSATVQGIMGEAMKVARRQKYAEDNVEEYRAPTPVDTLRAEEECPQCGNPYWDGVVCEVCGYVEEPESLSAPDTDKAKEQGDIPVETVEPKTVFDKVQHDEDEDTKKGGRLMARGNVTTRPVRRAAARPVRRATRRPVQRATRPVKRTARRPAQRGGITRTPVAANRRRDIARKRIEAARRAALRRRWAQESPVDTEPDAQVDVTEPGTVAPVSAPDAVTQVNTPGADVTDVSPDAVTQVDSGGTVPAAEPAAFPKAVDPGDAAKVPANPAVFPEEQSTEPQIEPQPSVTGRVAAFTSLRLAELRVKAGLDSSDTDLSVLATRLASRYSVPQMQAMIGLLNEIGSGKTVRGSRRDTRGLVPRRRKAKRTVAADLARKSAKRTSTPDEALFVR